jgi:hypothetical protein
VLLQKKTFFVYVAVDACADNIVERDGSGKQFVTQVRELCGRWLNLIAALAQTARRLQAHHRKLRLSL